MRTDEVTSRAVYTNHFIKIPSLDVFLFGQGTNHLKFSMPMLRGCRLVPLKRVSSPTNAAEGSEMELCAIRHATPECIHGGRALFRTT